MVKREHRSYKLSYSIKKRGTDVSGVVGPQTRNGNTYLGEGEQGLITAANSRQREGDR